MLRLSCVAAAAALLACAPGAAPDTAATGTGGAGQFVGSGGATSAGGQGGGLPPGCEGVAEKADLKPLHLYVAVDASSSMAGSKWTAARAGLATFFDSDDAIGTDVAMNFFPRPADATPACDQPAYKTPRVPYGLLPDNGPALLAAFDAETADGFNSPMYPALGGAILASIDVATANPEDVTAVLLVTDGAPDGPGTSCAGVDPSDPASVAALAANGLAFDPPVATFVVGLPGVDPTSANVIAAGGGTDAAIFVGATDTAGQFAEALAKVKGKALACAYEIPDGVSSGEISTGDVNVTITPTVGDPVTLPRNDACNGPGWTYDDPVMPTTILLCPASCQSVEDDPTAAIQIVLGCPTVK
ncbi:MAG TPA: vWA domain-containing protein [Polyangiaceae bacterium]|jgi:hypothetical protein|nr:vWA domain-containing protein [Polyangiaceae bacterium]